MTTSGGRRLIVAAAVLWSLGGVIAKTLTLDPLSIAFYRGLFAGLGLLPFVPRGQFRFRPVMLPVALVFGAMTALYIGSIKRTTAANAIFLQCTATFWTVPLGLLFLGERPNRRALAGIGLATIGIAAIVLFGYDGRPGESTGVALGLASGVGYAIVVVALRRLRDLDPLWLSAANNLGGALALAAWIGAAGGTIARPTLGQGVALFLFGLVQMAIPYALFARGLRTVPAAEAGLIGLLEPVLNPVWVVLATGERPAPATMAGGGLLLAGVACRYAPVRRPRAAAVREAEGTAGPSRG